MDLIRRSRELQIVKLVRSRYFKRIISNSTRGDMLNLSQEIRTNGELSKEEIKEAMSVIYHFASKQFN